MQPGNGGSSAASVSAGGNSRREDAVSNSGQVEESKVGETIGASSEQTMVTFSPEEQYAFVTLNYIIDNVCIHSAKQDEVRQQYSDMIAEAKNTGEDIVELQEQ